MENYGYTNEDSPDTYSNEYKSGDPSDLPFLITHEWHGYSGYSKKNKPADKPKNISWIEKLNWSLKKNNKNSLSNIIIDLKIEFEVIISKLYLTDKFNFEQK